ncbi:MAG: DUF2207 domain-containing protein, partial [Sphaerochaeta sp.]|nr:DUF2207 domain-containing protein [Sphaerochaeta sp.]
PAIGYALILTGNYLGPATLALIAVAAAASIPLLLVSHVMMRSWHIRKAVGKLFWPLVFLFVLAFGWIFLVVAGWIVDAPMDDILFGATLVMLANAPMGFLAIVTKQRSDFGRRRLEEVLGFRDFIEKVEMDDLKRMIDSDPNYYYHMLSFAIVLGLEKRWAKKFDSITLEPPSWYVGSHTVWNAMVLSSMLSRCNTALVSSVVTSPKASPGSRFGGSSFGGGGFSGGGFGGGGGGAW